MHSSSKRPGDRSHPPNPADAASAASATRSERERMIAETSSFLTWAMARGRQVPRIPRRRMDAGGFSELLKRPGARAAVEHWWHRVLDEVGA